LTDDLNKISETSNFNAAKAAAIEALSNCETFFFVVVDVPEKGGVIHTLCTINAEKVEDVENSAKFFMIRQLLRDAIH
jgi:hypothetical protein